MPGPHILDNDSLTLGEYTFYPDLDPSLIVKYTQNVGRAQITSHISSFHSMFVSPFFVDHEVRYLWTDSIDLHAFSIITAALPLSHRRPCQSRDGPQHAE